MKTDVIPAREEHCRVLAAALDGADGYPWNGDFIREHWGVEPEAGLLASLKGSPLCWSILIDGQIAGMFGCMEDGQVWLTTAPAIDRAKLRFIRQSRPYIEQMAERLGSVYGCAHRDNVPLLRWLEWCGFECAGTEGEFEIWVYRLS